MSDARLRELERRWKETGSVDDEAAYLLERVRVGDLTRERLKLAAYCGHEGARVAVPVADFNPNAFIGGLDTLSHRDQVKVSLAALEAALEVVPLDAESRRVFLACAAEVQAWLAQPASRKLSSAAEAAAQSAHLILKKCESGRRTTPLEAAAKAASQSVVATVDVRRCIHAIRAAEYALDLADHPDPLLSIARRAAPALLQG